MAKVTINLGGKKRELKFDLGIMSDYEDLTGDNALMDAIFQKLSAKKLRAMLFVILNVDEPEITLEQCGSFVTPDNMVEIISKLSEAFNNATPDQNKKKET